MMGESVGLIVNGTWGIFTYNVKQAFPRPDGTLQWYNLADIFLSKTKVDSFIWSGEDPEAIIREKVQNIIELDIINRPEIGMIE
jgi:hypothetical protein